MKPIPVLDSCMIKKTKVTIVIVTLKVIMIQIANDSHDKMITINSTNDKPTKKPLIATQNLATIITELDVAIKPVVQQRGPVRTPLRWVRTPLRCAK